MRLPKPVAGLKPAGENGGYFQTVPLHEVAVEEAGNSYLLSSSGFVATCPALPGLVTEGDTLEEARGMARDAIRACLESLHKDHRPIPLDRPPLAEQVHVVLPESA